MGKTVLFRWENSEALKHHCGFCDRPLSHPAAKSSCFGTHAEPCHRFHQMMFMRLRGHTCDMCMHTDEHHYKRHLKTCEQVRRIYESCGEDWPIIPNDGDDRGRSRSRGSESLESDARSSTSDDVPMRKKEKKEQKKQIRAASRTKVITQEEISYISSVLHPPSSQHKDIVHPNNPEEIEEIEQHLKYNAQCYNNGDQKLCNSKLLAHIPDADIDFDAEMERILDILRVSELLKRNERNRGLRHKELFTFKTLVADIKAQIIDDLILSKRDDLEVRMRRAAFLRYTNRASYDVMTSRYAEKDWRTGEKIRPVGSDSLGSLTVVDEEDGNDYGDLARLEEQPSVSQTTAPDNADRRHIEHSHKRLDEDGLFEQDKVIDTRLNLTASKPPPSLRIVSTKVTAPRRIKFHNPWGQRPKIDTPTPVAVRAHHTHRSTKYSSDWPLTASTDTWPSIGEAAGPTKSTQLPIESRKKKIQKKKPQVQRKNETVPGNKLSATTHSCPSLCDTELPTSPGAFTDASTCHNPTDIDEESPSDMVHTFTNRVESTNSGPTKGHDRVGAELFAADKVAVSGNCKEADKNDHHNVIIISDGSTHDEVEVSPSTSADNPRKIPTTKAGRHRDWIKFTDAFIVDGISNLIFTPDHPAYGSHFGCTILDCTFENSGTLNCPYHKTYCKCIDPLEPFNDKFIVYPDTKPICFGPFNCMRGEKLMRFFDTHPETKSRLMLVDEELYLWLQSEGRFWKVESSNLKKFENIPVPNKMPKRLMWEVEDLFKGYDKGRLLKQIDQFHDLSHRNELIGSRLSQPPITEEHLEDMLEKCEPESDADAFCYCKDKRPEDPSKDNDFVECAYSNCLIGLFHRRCAQKLGYDKVSTWYCGICERSMCVDAQKAILWVLESQSKGGARL